MVHLGIIPDGNRRWCKKKNIDLNSLTDQWITLILSHLNNYKKHKFKYLKMVNELSLYICSIDNINRNDNTKINIFNLIRKLYKINKDPLGKEENLIKEKFDYIKNNINFKANFIGDLELLPIDIRKIINEIKNDNSKKKK